MKKIILVLGFALSSHAFAAAPQPSNSTSQKICDSFQAKIDDECAHIMCDDQLGGGTFESIDQCVRDEDYSEAAQEGCDGQPTTMDDLVAKYNLTHPLTPVTCEQP